MTPRPLVTFDPRANPRRPFRARFGIGQTAHLSRREVLDLIQQFAEGLQTWEDVKQWRKARVKARRTEGAA
jgi:hypothetical protein